MTLSDILSAAESASRATPDAGSEFWMFCSPRHAEHAGFRNGRHKADRSIRCWHPGMDPASLHGVRPSRVVQSFTGNLTRQEQDRWAEAEHLLMTALMLHPNPVVIRL